MNNNETNEKKKKRKLLLWIIVGVVIVAVIVVFVLALTKKEKTEDGLGIGVQLISGYVEPETTTEVETAKETSTKDDSVEKETELIKEFEKQGTETGNNGLSSNLAQGGSSTKENQGSNTGGGNTASGGNTPTSHTHSWQAVYKTVTHPAVTQEVWVEDSATWDEPQYAYHDVCYTCGLDFNEAGFSGSDVAAHGKAHRMAGESDQFGTMQVQVGSIHHDATGHYETQTVSQAWSEQVFDHYECSCGAIK